MATSDPHDPHERPLVQVTRQIPEGRDPHEGSSDLATPTAHEVYKAFLRRRSAHTLDAYSRDLRAFAAYRDLTDARVAAEGLLVLTAGHANAIVLGWRQDMTEDGLAPATINRRLSTLRSMVKLAGQLGVVTWRLEVDNVTSESYRDTAGPTPEKVKELLAHADAKEPTPKNLRDAAILHTLFGMALRRFELVGIDVGHVDFKRSRIEITGKGRGQSEFATMPSPVVKSLKQWIEARKRGPGALFLSFDRARKGTGRLSGSGVRRIVRQAGKEVGIDLWPHALRHSSVTAVLDATDGDIRSAQRFARHKNPATTMKYDDNRRDLGGAAAEKMADYMDGLSGDEDQCEDL